MAAQKSQHYVPKVYLRSFSADVKRRSINLLNIGRRKTVPSASIKHQCAGSYFYGEDKALDTLFGDLEGRYGGIVRKLVSGELDTSSIDWLRMFVSLQHCRTRYALQRYREFCERGAAITFKGKRLEPADAPALSHKEAMMGALSQFTNFRPAVEDLKFRIFRNETDIAFVTSDNPALLTNRFYLQQLKRDDFGIANSGAILIMPIAPSLVACFYDGCVYATKGGSEFVSVDEPKDVLALNELQYLSAHENIYFSDFSDAERLTAEFEAVCDLRPKDIVRIQQLVEVERSRIEKVYRMATDQADADSGRSNMLVFQTAKPLPRTWPSMIPFRNNKKTYENGSGVGFVRRPEWLTHMPS